MTPHTRVYIGGGASIIHHTGYDRDRPVLLEQWEKGGKVFGGVEFRRWAAVEFAYHHLSSSPYFPTAAGPAGGRERSYALVGTVLIHSPYIFNSWVPMRLFLRGGAAYKHITDDNGAGLVQREDGLSYVLGFGGEAVFGRHWFLRVEYEYISKIHTKQAVNVQHTPISVSLGARY